jgi:uncharacterized membrane protein SirB2
MLKAYYNDSLEGTNEAFWQQCQISLITVSKGEPLYSWFGHSAFLVEAPDYPAYVYDYGSFSFNDEDFYKNFAMGRLWFCCSVTYATYELAYLDSTGRTYSQVKLNLTAGQKKAIINFLNVNSSSEHNTYLYNHYTDNCATRLRDILNYATDGDFEAWAKTITGHTYRQIASSALSQNRPLQWLLEFLQSGQIDGATTLWDEMFLPAILEQAVIQYGLQTGLVTADSSLSSSLLPSSSQPDTLNSSALISASGVQVSSNLLFSVLTGLALGLICFLLLYRAKTKDRWGLYRAYSFTVNLLFGLMGTLLMFMMFFTNHNVTWYNENLLFVNPVLIVLAILSLRKSSEKTLSIMYRILLAIMAILVALKIVLPNVFLQDNWSAIVMLAPFYAVKALKSSK